MPDSTGTKSSDNDASQVAEQLVGALDAAGCDYALGGAIALGYWAEPRGTVDMDVTLYLPPDKPTESVRLLQHVQCELDATKAQHSLSEHGFCQVTYAGRRLDVFLPMIPFYATAAKRRKRVPLGKREAWIWDAETLCVFKMMFFRRKDLADVESILRTQGRQLDAAWVELQLVEMYGARDPRVSEWREIAAQCLG